MPDHTTTGKSLHATRLMAFGMARGEPTQAHIDLASDFLGRLIAMHLPADRSGRMLWAGLGVGLVAGSVAGLIAGVLV